VASVQVDTETVRLLTEIGFMAMSRGKQREAEAIFAGVQAVRPKSETPAIGLALTRIGARKLDEAIRILRDDALARNPDSAEAKCYLGMALKLAGRASEADKVLREAAGAATGETKARAKSLLQHR
jgi:predicted Zn-dependent protease